MPLDRACRQLARYVLNTYIHSDYMPGSRDIDITKAEVLKQDFLWLE